MAVPLPDIQGRRQILQYYMADKPVAADVNRDLIARQTPGFSGADLSNLINEAALLAAKEGHDAISGHMVDYAFDKIRMGVERKSAVRSPESIKRTAYHESGHALVALHVQGASPIHKATVVPRGHALGMVTQVRLLLACQSSMEPVLCGMCYQTKGQAFDWLGYELG